MEEVGLYIHIPFCKSKCVYCDFCSFEGKTDEDKKLYVETLIKEIGLYKEVMQDKVIKTIYLGGGTPTFLETQDIESIMNEIKKNFNLKEDIEVTIEANPGTLNIEKLTKLGQIGFNRLSMGLQSANEATLKTLSRIHTYDDCVKDIEDARKAGFENINLDIMFSLPNEKLKDVKNTLDKVLSLNVEHISAYSLIVEEGTKMEKMVNDENYCFPDEDEDREIYYYICDRLKESGYHHYEISNFAKEGFESRHNIIYWKAEEYLGLGLAAHSYLNGYRFSNANEMRRYISRIKDENKITYLNGRKEKQSIEDKISEFMFLGLRMLDGISVSEFKSKFNLNIEEVYGDIINEMILDGVMERKGDLILLTKRGIDVSNMIFAEFML